MDECLNFVNDCIKAIQDRITALGHLNIIVVGKTGVGKSTLINSVFSRDMATVGLGKPVTDNIRELTLPDFPLTIFDTQGFELDKDIQEKVLNEVLGEIQNGLQSKDINKTIHCILYCINSLSNRIEPMELKWIRDFTEENKITQVPVIVVLTQSISKKKADDLRKVIIKENLDIKQVVPVLAQDYDIDDEHIISAYGLDTLINVMGNVLPEELQVVLQHVQKADLKAKKDKAQIAVTTAVAASVAEAASPIPFSDSIALIGTQVTMIASITVIYGLEVSKSLLYSFVSIVLGTGGATFAGRGIVAGLLKLIPGAGTVTGGVINASTAGLLTTALGEAYIILMEEISKGDMKAADLKTDKGKKELQKLVIEQISSI